MPLQGVLQTRWLRGLNAAFGIFSQPPNSLPRISNLILTRRGALETTPGSRIVSSFDNLGPEPWNPLTSGMWKEIFYYNPVVNPQNAGYYGLFANVVFPRLQGSVGTPAGTVVAITNAVTAAFPGTQFAVTAADGVGGESVLSAPVTATVGANHGLQLTFSYVPNAFGYNVYMLNGGIWQRLVPQGSTNPLSTTLVNHPPVAPATTLTFLVANISQANLPPGNPQNVIGLSVGSIGPPTVDTTQTCNFVFIPVDGTGWNNANVSGARPHLIYIFPADFLPNPGGGGSGQQGGGRTPSGGGGPAGTISGGVSGIISPIPQIIQFADRMFLALGNGIIPFVSDGTTPALGPPGPSGQVPPGTGPIINTFQAQYPFWHAGIGYIVGDQIYSGVVGSPGNFPPPFYLFTAIQGGISQGGAGGLGGNANGPDFSLAAKLDQTVIDGQVIWKNTGPISNPPPPSGAAHAEVYAGSLWVANTAPVFTPANATQGPSALWMSDANNPISWNPLNTAQVARDDGTEIMGLKAFSIAEAGIPTTQQLAVFKNFTTYVVNSVFGAPDFAIQQALTDQGCIAPRTIQFIPGFGLIRLTHLGFSYFDSVKDVLLSTELHPYLFGDPDQPDIQPIDWTFAYFSKGAQVADPPMYIAACPILGDNCQLLGTIPASQFVITPNPGAGTSFPAGNYFFRISLRGPLLETAVTPQIGPISLTSAGIFTVLSTVPIPPGYTGWRIYWGANGPGSESHYQDTGPELGGSIPIPLTYPGLSTTGPPIGLSGSLTRIFCFDLTLKCWTVVDLPFSISVLKQFRIMGEPPVVFAGGFWDTTVRRLFSNAPDWDGVPIDWKMRTTEVYNQGGDVRVFYRRLRIRGSGDGPIQITPNYDGFDDVTLPAVFRALGGNQFMAEAGLMAEAVNCHADIEGQGQVLINSLDFHAVPKPIGAGVVIS